MLQDTVNEVIDKSDSEVWVLEKRVHQLEKTLRDLSSILHDVSHNADLFNIDQYIVNLGEWGNHVDDLLKEKWR
jgi:hypothetical protein